MRRAPSGPECLCASPAPSGHWSLCPVAVMAQELADLQAKHREVEAERNRFHELAGTVEAQRDAALSRLEQARRLLDRPAFREHHELCDLMDFHPGAPVKPCNCGRDEMRTALGAST